jgi:glutaconate CoA-transferase subunit A
MNRADAAGNGQYLGDDPYFDPLFAMAAKRRFLSAERIVETADFLSHGPKQSLCIHRGMTDGVVEAPMGAHFTSCEPDYGRDEPFQRAYAAAAADPAAYQAFKARYLDLESHDAYRAAITTGTR